MVIAKRIHDDVRTGTAVEDISQNVQGIDSQPLDKVAQGNDEVIGTSCVNDGTDDDIDIGLLVGVHGAFVKQFLNNVGKFFRQCLADL